MNLLQPRNLTAELGSIAYVGATTKTFEIERNGFIKEMILLLEGTFTVSVAAGTAIPSESPQNLISKIELLANGGEVIKSYDGSACYRLACNNACLNLTRVQPGYTVAAHPFSVPLILQFRQPQARSPVDTVLPAHQFDSLFLKITFADGTADKLLAVKDGSTFAVTACTVKVVAKYADIPGWANRGFSLFKEIQSEQDIAATAAEYAVDLVLGSQYRRILLQTYDDYDLADTIINKFSMRAGVSSYYINNVSRALLKAEGEILYGFAQAAGNYMLEFADEGRLSTCIPSNLLQALQVILNVTKTANTCTLKTTTGEIVPAMPGRFISRRR